MKKLFALCLVSLALLAGCKSTPKVPDSSTPVKETVRIYPDYRDIVIPPNIAPLNIQVQSAGQAFVATFDGGGMQVVAGSNDGNTLKIDSTAWRQMLDKARGQSVRVTVYARRDGGWVRFPAYTLEVAREPIDRYLSYRLIEPGYEIYRQLGLYQRDLTSFDVHTIYENNRTFDNDNNHCINCHNYQNTGNNSDHCCAECVKRIASCRDSDKSGKRTVKTHRNIRLSVFNPGEHHRGASCNRRRNSRGKEN